MCSCPTLPIDHLPVNTVDGFSNGSISSSVVNWAHEEEVQNTDLLPFQWWLQRNRSTFDRCIRTENRPTTCSETYGKRKCPCSVKMLGSAFVVPFKLIRCARGGAVSEDIENVSLDVLAQKRLEEGLITGQPICPCRMTFSLEHRWTE